MCFKRVCAHVGASSVVAVTSVRFANNEKYLLGCCSADGNLSICRLDPPCVLYMLKGHRAKVSGGSTVVHLGQGPGRRHHSEVCVLLLQILEVPECVCQEVRAHS